MEQPGIFRKLFQKTFVTGQKTAGFWLAPSWLVGFSGSLVLRFLALECAASWLHNSVTSRPLHCRGFTGFCLGGLQHSGLSQS